MMHDRLTRLLIYQRSLLLDPEPIARSSGNVESRVTLEPPPTIQDPYKRPGNPALHGHVNAPPYL